VGDTDMVVGGTDDVVIDKDVDVEGVTVVL
jgi:hypothetical protein